MNLNKNLIALHEAIISGNTNSAPSFIKSNEFLSAEARLKIYIDSYRLRLTQTLENDFACFIHLAGEQARCYIESYIEATPPNHYNLDHYHLRFVSFLKALDIPRNLLEMAILESAIAEVFWQPRSEPLNTEFLKNITPNQFGNIKLNLIKAAKLCHFKYDCNNYLSKFHNGKAQKNKPRKTENYLLVYRPERTVINTSLTQAEFIILSKISEGSTVLESIEAAMSDKTLNQTEIASNIQNWFADWISKGYFESK